MAEWRRRVLYQPTHSTTRELEIVASPPGLPVDQLGFEGGDQRFGHGIVTGIGDCPD